MAKKNNGDDLLGFLILFLIFLFFTYPIESIFIISVCIGIYIYYKRIKREEREREERIKRENRERIRKESERREKERFEAGYQENMSGEDYEKYCKYILKQKGWIVKLTPKSGDQGVDLIASKESLKVCIQCKRYSKPVGNKAVQEIFTGKQYYDGSHGVLVSNAGFTKSAKSLALKTEIILLSDINLKSLEAYCAPV